MTFHSQNAAGDRESANSYVGFSPAREEVVRQLDEADRRGAQTAGPCRLDLISLTKLIGYVIDKHHVYARRQVARIDTLLAELSGAHETSNPELSRVRSLFKVLRQELLFHMAKEEVSIFPRIIRTEAASRPDDTQAPPDPGAMRDAVRMLLHDHDKLCELLDEMRAATNDYTPPRGGGEGFDILYRELRELETDMLEHIHLEDNLLFPRALQTERRG